MSGRRDPQDDKALLSEVSRMLHVAKANKKLIANKRRTAKLAARRGGGSKDAATSAPAAQSAVAKNPSPKSSAKKSSTTAAQDVNTLPPGTVAMKNGGSVWVTFKCELDAIRRRGDAAAKAERGVEQRAAFVLPAENRRSRMRAEKAQRLLEEAQAEAATDEVQDAPPVEEPAAEEAAEAPADADDAGVAYYVSALETLIANVGAGAGKCIVRTTSSLSRKIQRAAQPATGKGKNQKPAKRRRVKKQRTTALLTTQKQATNFATNFVALLRKDVYPLLIKDAATEPSVGSSQTAAAQGAAKTAAHKDPHAEPTSKATATAGQKGNASKASASATKQSSAPAAGPASNPGGKAGNQTATAGKGRKK